MIHDLLIVRLLEEKARKLIFFKRAHALRSLRGVMVGGEDCSS